MYCYYAAKNSWTLAEVLSDVKTLVTGGLLANLSASCDKARSTHITTVAGGWTLHDNTANSGGWVDAAVVSAADTDSLTTKYVHLMVSGTNTLNMRVLEDWDASLNTTTNASYSWDGYSIGTVGQAFGMHIVSSRAYLYVGNVSSNPSGIFCGEVRRDTPFLANATVKPLVHFSMVQTAINSVANAMYTPRLRNPKTGATMLTTSAGFSLMCMGPRYWTTSGSSNVWVGQTAPTFASNGTRFHHVRPLLYGWADTTPYNTIFHGRAAVNSAGYGPVMIRGSADGIENGYLVDVEGVTYVAVLHNYGFMLPYM